MRRAVELVRDAFVQLAEGQAVVPLRTAIEVPEHEGVALFMPALLRGSESLAVKAVSVFPRNRERGLPTISALVVAIDPATGRPSAILDGTFVTALRTGAVTGVAADLLARPDSRVLALFGAGGQAWHQVEAVLAVRPIAEVRVFTRDPAHAGALAERLRAGRPELAVSVAPTPRAAVAGAD